MSRTASVTARKSGHAAKVRRGPGRPTAARIAQINTVILEQATQEFLRAGYQAAKMETIAANARVSKGTLYDRYPTKKALLSAVISHHVARAAAARDPLAAANASTDLRQQLKHRARQLAQAFCSVEFEFLERLFSEDSELEGLKKLTFEVGHEQTMNAIAQDIIDGKPHQAIDRQSAVRIAEMLTSMIYGWWRTQREYNRPVFDELLSYAEFAVDVLLDGRTAWANHS